MDVGELLRFNPDKPDLKRKTTNDETSVESKLKRSTGEVTGNELTEEEREKILRMVEQEPDGPAMDEADLRQLILRFEKKVYKNQEMRIKYPDQPEKFMTSEVDLNDAIQEMHVIATNPNLYHYLVDLNAVKSLLGLISHGNTDISIAVIDLLQELTDVDTLNESEEAAEALVDALLEDQIVATLVQNLDRLDDNLKEESEAIHNTLGIIENMTEFRPEMCVDAGQQGLMQWLLKRLKSKLAFDANKLYCSEILAILLQDTPENRELLGEVNGIDSLLQRLAGFKRHDPTTTEEIEMMENLFNCMCSALMLPSNRGRFLKGEGVQLMNLMLREKKLSRFSALKVLDHAMTGDEGAENCNKFVEILGLRSVFPLFMKTHKKHKKGGISEDDHEEHVSSIIASMLKHCTAANKLRVINKFVENDHAKVDRLMELHFKYLTRVQNVDDRIEKEKQARLQGGDIIDDDQEDEYYLRRLDAGLFTLQLIDYIMLELSCSSGVSTIKQRILQLLNMHKGSITAVRNVVREYAGNIGDAKSKEHGDAERQRLLELVNRF
ncbi:beta-catenin-like protein 1 [Antedon mediterranea]|uniref:beta-catenin-like protein 1 n=1 Tax=Antedon mediterranea TaxID=105859 RepID=UPI003AF9B0C3